MGMRESATGPDARIPGHLTPALSGLDAESLLRVAIKELFPGRIALVSSFGAESAVLLHMAAKIDKALPVLFVDTGVMFPETLAYRDTLVDHLGLSNVKSARPSAALLAVEDPENFLWSSNPDRCCEIRKVFPLAEALEPYEAWISGRKRFQAHTRSDLPLFEPEGGRIKVNPLAEWGPSEILSYMETHGLPRHPLVAKGYLSIGCIACTSPVKPGEHSRAGRWRGREKVECGLHTLPLYAGADI